MQIHELNNYNGSLDSSAYVAVDNGSDTGKASITDITDPLNARIDNIIAGDAPSAAEVTDGRLGFNGVTYPSLGDAIRDQIEPTNTAVDIASLNWVLGALDNATGAEYSSTTRIRSDFTEVTEGTIVSLSGNANCLAVYEFDENKVFLNSTVYVDNDFTVPTGTYYIRVVIRKASYNPTIDPGEVSTQADRCSIMLKFSQETVLLKYGNDEIGDIKKNADDALQAVKVGGINAFPDYWIQGKYISTGGGFNNSPGMWLSDYVPIGDDLDKVITDYTATTKNAVVCVGFYASDKSFIEGTNYTSSGKYYYNIPSGAAYLVMSVGNWNTAYTLEEVLTGCSIVFNTAVLELLDPSIVRRCADQIENVFAGSGTFRAWDNGGVAKKNFALLMMSDTHGDTVRLRNAVELLEKCDAIDAAIHLGDAENSAYGSGRMAGMVSILNQATKPLFVAMGNHDGRQLATTNCTVEQAVAAFPKATTLASIYDDRGYGYYDFATYKIRLIILNAYDFPNDKSNGDYVYYGGDPMYLKDQIDWFVSTLGSTPDDYTVIVATHYAEPTNLDQDTLDQHVGTANVYGLSDTRGSDGHMGDTVIGDIINAFRNMEALTKTYTYTPQGSVTVLNVSADFTGRTAANFACYISGHVHCQSIGHLWNYADQVAYFNDTSCLYANDTSSMWTTCWSLLPRDPEGKSQDVLTVLCVDPDNKMINFVRVGANRNMFGEDSDFIHYTYE